MKYLPLALSRGRLLGEVMDLAAQGGPKGHTCGWCGTRLHANLDRAGRMARCTGCGRAQRVDAQEEVPWRLTPSAAETLRRTRTWLRRL